MSTTSNAYLHCRPNGTPFYVGKGALRRVRSLLGRNPHHRAIVTKYGRDNILVGFLECSSSQTAFDLEIGMIKCLRRMGVSLCNYTAGGEGGKEPCEETRQKLSIAAKIRGVSAACQTAKIKAKTGKPLSDEQKAKQSAAMKGIIFTEEHRSNISISAKKRGMGAMCRAASLAAIRGRVQPEEEKIRRGSAIKKALAESGKTVKTLVDGVLFPSIADAAKHLHVSHSGVLWALKHSGVIKGNRVERML